MRALGLGWGEIAVVSALSMACSRPRETTSREASPPSGAPSPRAASAAAPPCDGKQLAALPRLPVTKGGKEVPYCTTAPLSGGSAEITAAIVVVHGNNRDVWNDFEYVAAGAGAHAATTVVVAPYFQARPAAATASDCQQEKDGEEGPRDCPGAEDHPAAHDLYWGCAHGHDWKEGSPAVDEPTSSFAALDALVLALRKSFPGLKRMTIAGFSAGGQLVQRYAAASAAAAQVGVPVHYVVGDPSSWMYLDDARLVQGTPCSDPDHCQLGAASFHKPTFHAPCPCYDTYKYGLTGISGIMADANKIRDRYRKLDMTYLAAEHDDGPQAGAAYSPLDKGCEADAQGPIVAARHDGKTVSHSFRAQRALTFWHYATEVLGAAHRLLWVKGCGHDPRCVYGNGDVKALLFAR